MPTATDTVLETHQLIAAGVGAWPGFAAAVKAANFIASDDPKNKWQDRIRNAKQAADFPYVLFIPGRGREAPNAVQTLCGNRQAENLMPFVFTILGYGRDIVAIGQVAAEIKAWWKSVGSQLGNASLVAMSRIASQSYEDAPAKISGGVDRRMCVLTLEVKIKG